MREPELAARVRDRELPVVEVSGEDEVEGTGLDPVDDAREVTEEDAEVGGRVGEPFRPSSPAHVGTRVDADDLDPAAA